jgi:hypothetical protein
MTTKQIGIAIAAGLVALGLAFSAGRFSAPTKTIETEKIVEKKVVDQKAIADAVAVAQSEWKKNEKVNTTTKTVYKDGKISEKYVFFNKELNSSGNSLKLDTMHSDNSTLTSSETTTEKKKVTISEQPRWQVGMNANLKWNDLNLTPSAIIWEGHAQVRVIGGLWAGLTTTPQLKLIGVGLNYQF